MYERSINAAKFARAQPDLSIPENAIAKVVVDAALAVHTELGPGLLESVYEGALAIELTKRGLSVRRQVPVAVVYDGIVFDEGFRIDILVNELVVLELKSVEAISSTHVKTLLTYLRFSKKRLGLLINFRESALKNGIKRLANGLQASTPS